MRPKLKRFFKLKMCLLNRFPAAGAQRGQHRGRAPREHPAAAALAVVVIVVLDRLPKRALILSKVSQCPESRNFQVKSIQALKVTQTTRPIKYAKFLSVFDTFE